MSFLKKLFSGNKQLYPELELKERIAAIVVNHILPEFESDGFQFVKSNVKMKRTTGDFEQEISFYPVSRYTKQLNLLISVRSKTYIKWIKDHYKIRENPADISVLTAKPEFIPGWVKDYFTSGFDGGYDLESTDNMEIVKSITSNIRNAVLNHFNALSDWNSLIDYFITYTQANPQHRYHYYLRLIDFCLMMKKYDQSLAARDWYWQIVQSSTIELQEKELDAIRLRENKMQELGICTIDTSRYPINPKELSGYDNVFISGSELEKRVKEHQDFVATIKSQHGKRTDVNEEGVSGSITFHSANPIPPSKEELDSYVQMASRLPHSYSVVLNIENLRYRPLDIAYDTQTGIFATAHADGIGIIWNANGELIKDFNFNKNIPTTFNSIEKVSFLDPNTVVFEAPHKVFICDHQKIVLELCNNPKRSNEKTLYYTLKPSFNEVITAGFRDKIVRWNYKAEITSELLCEDNFFPVAHCAHTGYFALNNEKGVRRIIDRDGKTIFEFKGHKDNRFFQFTPKGDRLIETGHSSKIFVVNVQTQEIQTLKPHDTQNRGYAENYAFANFGVSEFSISGDGNFLCVGSTYSVNVLWNLENFERVDLKGHRDRTDLFQDGLKSIAFAPNNQSILTADKDGTCIHWNLRGEMLARLIGHTETVTKAIFADNMDTVYSISDDMTIKKWRKNPT